MWLLRLLTLATERLRRRRAERELIASSGLFDARFYRERFPECQRRSADPVIHYLTAGAAVGLDPNPLFATSWYLTQNPDVAKAGLNPLWHYITSGVREGRDPNPLFDTDWYLAQNPDVANAGLNPLWHYLTSGAAEGRDPNPLFDTDWYLAQNPDVTKAGGLNPLCHYLTSGVHEGRDPNPLFDTDWYLGQNPDVANAGVNPLWHYLTSGVLEGHDPNPLFDTDWYLAQNPDVARAGLNPLWHYLSSGASEGRDPNPLFDTDWYLAQNPDVATAGLNPLWHYLARDAAKGRDPNPLFDTDWYLSENAHVIGLGINPLAHFVSFGAGEGLRPNPYFDPLYYLDHNPSVASAGYNPLAHYREFGGREARDPCAEFDTELYLAQVPRAERNDYETPLEHYLNKGKMRGLQTNLFYDPIDRLGSAAEFSAVLSVELPAVLMVCHAQGGGTERHVRDLARFCRERFQSLMLTPKPDGNARLSLIAPESVVAIDFRPLDQLDQLVGFLRQCRVERVHIHHALGHEHYLRKLIAKLGKPFDFTIHDYFVLSPQPHLVDANGQFVGENLAAAEEQLLTNSSKAAGVSSLCNWQNAHRWLLVEANRVIAPSADSARRYRAHLPEARIIVAPHLEPAAPATTGEEPQQSGRNRLRIAVLGSLTPHKGYDVVLGCARYARRYGLSLTFRLIGYSIDDDELANMGVVVTGRYDDEDLDQAIAAAEPDVIWYPVQCPETYSYTLTAGLRSRLPLVVPDLGSFPERVRGWPEVWVEPWDRSPRQWAMFFIELRERHFAVAGSRSGTQEDMSSFAACSFYLHDYREAVAKPYAGDSPSRRSTMACGHNCESIRAP